MGFVWVNNGSAPKTPNIDYRVNGVVDPTTSATRRSLTAPTGTVFVEELPAAAGAMEREIRVFDTPKECDDDDDKIVGVEIVRCRGSQLTGVLVRHLYVQTVVSGMFPPLSKKNSESQDEPLLPRSVFDSAAIISNCTRVTSMSSQEHAGRPTLLQVVNYCFYETQLPVTVACSKKGSRRVFRGRG